MNQVLLMSGLISVLISSTVLAAKGSDKALDNNPPPSTGNKINACVHKTKGDMRTVATSNQCNKHEYYISWNIQGPTGDTGSAGAKGDTGIAGATGDTGIAGATGDTGIAGVKGDTGIAGAKGDTGIAGVKGDTGIAGAKGDTGIAGATGDTGIAGVKGDTGIAGAKGDTGIAGVKGDTGIAGAKGDTGIAGATGDTGIAGVKGDTGIAGAKGDTGIAGAKGDTGIAGVKGDTGIAGAKGDTGIAGVKGDTGPRGAMGVAGGQPIVVGDNPQLGGFVIQVTLDGQHGIVLYPKNSLPTSQHDHLSPQTIRTHIHSINFSPPPNTQSVYTQYDDWKLPTYKELRTIYSQNVELVTGFIIDDQITGTSSLTNLNALVLWQWEYNCYNNVVDNDIIAHIIDIILQFVSVNDASNIHQKMCTQLTNLSSIFSNDYDIRHSGYHLVYSPIASFPYSTLFNEFARGQLVPIIMRTF